MSTGSSPSNRMSAWRFFPSSASLKIAILCVILIVDLQLAGRFCSSQKTTDPITIDLHHRLSSDQHLKPRGSIVVRPKTEYRVASASIIDQVKLTDADLKALEEASAKGDSYYLQATAKRGPKNNPTTIKTTQTLIKACSLYDSNLADFIAVNLSPTNNFISINLFTTQPECLGSKPSEPSKEFNTTVLVEYGSTGPLPDTATYIRRLEEERQSKLKEGKEDNRSFILKYWMYIVPAVVFLMVFSGPADQGR